MTNNIPGIGINTGSVNPYGGKTPGQDPKTEDKPEAPKTAPQGQTVNPDDVLTYMAQTAVVVQPKVAPPTYDVAKYVTQEQAERIAGFVVSFEDKVAEGLAAITAELGENAPLTDQQKYEIAAGMV